MKMNNKETDWTNYDQQKRSFFSTFTQQYTLVKIIHALTKWTNTEKGKIHVLELGGGNSCFAEAVCHNTNILRYDIIDNNILGIDLFNKKNLKAIFHQGIIGNLTENVSWDRQYDFVYSIGLIEHFDRDNRSKVINAHFQFCNDNGIVMISFPTPTFKYWFVRKCIELVGKWQFWDEKPLTLDDVKRDLEKNGIIEHIEINRKLPLSQMIIIVRKSSQ